MRASLTLLFLIWTWMGPTMMTSTDMNMHQICLGGCNISDICELSHCDQSGMICCKKTDGTCTCQNETPECGCNSNICTKCHCVQSEIKCCKEGTCASQCITSTDCMQNKSCIHQQPHTTTTTAPTDASEPSMPGSQSLVLTTSAISLTTSLITTVTVRPSTSLDNSKSSNSSILIGTSTAIIFVLLLTLGTFILIIACLSNKRSKRKLLHYTYTQENTYEEINRIPLGSLNEQTITSNNQFSHSLSEAMPLSPANSMFLTLDEWSRATKQGQQECTMEESRSASSGSSEHEIDISSYFKPLHSNVHLDQYTQASTINVDSLGPTSASTRHDLSIGQTLEKCQNLLTGRENSGVLNVQTSVDYEDNDVPKNQIPKQELVNGRINSGEIESEYSLLGEDHYDMTCTEITGTDISKAAIQQHCGKEDDVYSVVKKNHKENKHVKKPVTSGHNCDFDDDNEASPPIPPYQPNDEPIM